MDRKLAVLTLSLLAVLVVGVSVTYILRSNLVQTRANLSISEQRLSEANKQLVDTTNNLADANKQLVDTSNSLADANQDYLELEKEVATFKVSLKSVVKELDSTQEELASLRQKVELIGNLEEYINNLEERKRALNLEIDELVKSRTPLIPQKIEKHLSVLAVWIPKSPAWILLYT